MLVQLLHQLEAAVRAGDRVLALELARLIQQQLVRDQHDQAGVERRVRELLAELQAPAAPPRVVDFAAHEAVRVLAPAGSPGVVYPVWFGTNRKPNALGTGFTGERHDRVTRGRVEVYVPEAHRFGESGTPFWKKLLRFDLRDDSLRVQRVERQERDAFFAEIQAALHTARESGESPHALVFLHGFNVSFEEAAIRAAQIGVDLKVPGRRRFSVGRRAAASGPIQPTKPASRPASGRSASSWSISPRTARPSRYI